ncbi:MAG TPA: translation initiation factor IF-2 [Verrucomicrobiota bacterium]|nr:translation initiation factor IF-2 [Verrucomicrobiales bacterium]HRI12153.1 translation initiation factor IF-2 [Verrucomicrobiota bacterium]
MPVRIYEIAKELKLENKVVLSKAKELGIAAAKVASSSLDKITAEYLRDQLLPLAAVATPAAEPVAPPESDRPVIIVPPPPPPPEPPVAEVIVPAEGEVAVPAEPLVAPVTAESPPTVTQVVDDSAAAGPVVEPPTEASVPAAAPAVPATPPKPPKPAEPAKPRVGDLVGRVNLPQFNRGRGGQGASGGRDDRGRGGPDRGRPQQAPARPPTPTPPPRPPVPRIQAPSNAPVIIMKPPIAIRELAEKMNRRAFQIIADLMGMGVFVTVNQTIDAEVAQRLCAKNGFRFETERRDLETHKTNIQPRERKIELDKDDIVEDLHPRAPIITIMGHVDHGKTTLLDRIRKSNVAAGEAGGITQHIGAYTISYPHPVTSKLEQLTFLDTPGHAAFSAMRARGANVTDIVVLVVAANDGVMPQTLEALAHARVARVPIIVAVNKADHPAANGLKVRQQLQEKGLVPDDWGGDTLYVDCSGLTGLGVDKLIESILLQAELLELKANPNRKAKGNVIESGIEPGGPVATVLVRKGTLRQGDVIISGEFYGKVRSMMDEEGKRLKEAGPSVAVRVLGLNGVPEAGSEFSAVESEKAARDLAEERKLELRKTSLDGGRPRRQTLEDIFGRITDQSAKVLKVIVKADTQGSVEAICEALRKIESEKVSLEIIRDAVGAITENDVLLASSGDAVILGFHTRVDNSAAEAAKHEGVQIKLYAIIYELIDQVKEAMAGLLDPLQKEVVVGQAEVRKVFELSKGGKVAGCYVSSGKLVRGKMRVRRKGHAIYEGVSLTLKRFQDEVNEVRSGMECGVRLDGFDDPQEGDVIECYVIEKVAQKLS